MKLFTRLFALILCAALCLSVAACATVARTDSDDPFSNQLDNQYATRTNAQNWMLASAISLALGVVTGTIFTTMSNMNQMSQTTAFFGIIASYSVSTVAAGVGTYELFRWNKAFDEYLETLRLQTQYYNAIEWTNKSSY